MHTALQMLESQTLPVGCRKPVGLSFNPGLTTSRTAVWFEYMEYMLTLG
jgi:hypothetical protein